MPIPWSEIAAWAKLYGIRPKEWELDGLSMLDDLWLSIMSKEHVSAEDLLEEAQAQDDVVDIFKGL